MTTIVVVLAGERTSFAMLLSKTEHFSCITFWLLRIVDSTDIFSNSFVKDLDVLNKRNILLYIFFAIMISPEIINIFNTSDDTAHMVHIIGATLGFISLFIRRYKGLPDKIASIIS